MPKGRLRLAVCLGIAGCLSAGDEPLLADMPKGRLRLAVCLGIVDCLSTGEWPPPLRAEPVKTRLLRAICLGRPGGLSSGDESWSRVIVAVIPAAPPRLATRGAIPPLLAVCLGRDGSSGPQSSVCGTFMIDGAGAVPGVFRFFGVTAGELAGGLVSALALAIAPFFFFVNCFFRSVSSATMWTGTANSLLFNASNSRIFATAFVLEGFSP
jgi:hypothetical protein